MKIKTRKLKVGPHLYTVQWLTGEQYDKKHSNWDKGSTVGCCHLSMLRIDIRMDLEEGPVATTKLQETLLHEVIHAVWSSSGLTDGGTEEANVTALSPALLDTFHRNPWLLAELQPAA